MSTRRKILVHLLTIFCFVQFFYKRHAKKTALPKAKVMCFIPCNCLDNRSFKMQLMYVSPIGRIPDDVLSNTRLAYSNLSFTATPWQIEKKNLEYHLFSTKRKKVCSCRRAKRIYHTAYWFRLDPDRASINIAGRGRDCLGY